MSGMLSEAQIADVSKHEVVHRMGMCTCPCFDALMSIAAQWNDLATENPTPMPYPEDDVREAVRDTLDVLAARVEGSDLPLGISLDYNRGYSAALAAVLALIAEARR